ncbi:MAG: B12-binding domain-containing radical SAM protein, partial [Magnetococcales bacterium]|nr:B12-binding domain-containing radical SAM protein [Magnetococcales bacterium]
VLQLRYYAFPPYGIGILKRNLEKRDYTVRLEDLNYRVLAAIHQAEGSITTPEDLTRIWQTQLRNAIEAFKPDIVGLSCMYTMTHDITIRNAEFIKSIRSDLPVIVGGVHATTSMETVLHASPAIDLVALYEGDTHFGDLLDFARGLRESDTLAQIALRLDGATAVLAERSTPRAEEIQESPDFGDLPIGDYSRVGQVGIFNFWYGATARAASLMANRGCRARCSFCSVRHFNGPGVRQREAARVVEEMTHLKRAYGVTHFTWLDDDLFYNTKKCLELFDAMANANLGMTWDASNGVLASSVVNHPEIIDAAARAGCIGLGFGIETGSERLLRQVHKPCTIKHFRKLGGIMKHHPEIFTKGFLMLGFPGETVREIKQTIALAQEMRLDWYSVQVVSPLPTTEMFNQFADTEGWERGTLHFGIRESERQKKVESSGHQNFFRLLDADDDSIPDATELYHIWFDFDFSVNYPRLFKEDNPTRLKKIQFFLTDVCDRRVGSNPIPNLFLALVNAKLGLFQDVERRVGMAREFFRRTHYWNQRLQGLGIELDDLIHRCRTAPRVN